MVTHGNHQKRGLWVWGLSLIGRMFTYIWLNFLWEMRSKISNTRGHGIKTSSASISTTVYLIPFKMFEQSTRRVQGVFGFSSFQETHTQRVSMDLAGRRVADFLSSKNFQGVSFYQDKTGTHTPFLYWPWPLTAVPYPASDPTNL